MQQLMNRREALSAVVGAAAVGAAAVGTLPAGTVAEGPPVSQAKSYDDPRATECGDRWPAEERAIEAALVANIELEERLDRLMHLHEIESGGVTCDCHICNDLGAILQLHVYTIEALENYTRGASARRKHATATHKRARETRWQQLHELRTDEDKAKARARAEAAV